MGSHLVVGLDIQLNLLAGECSDSIKEIKVSFVFLQGCSCRGRSMMQSASSVGRTHLISILAAGSLSRYV